MEQSFSTLRAASSTRPATPPASVARASSLRAPHRLRLFLGLSSSLLPGLLLGVLLGACLGPQVDDEVPGQGLVLPAGTQVGAVDPDIARQIAEFDAVDGLVPALSGFAAGSPVVYWDFGPAPWQSAPLFYLSDPDTGDLLDDHPPIFDVIPGDDQYSPFWAMFLLPVSDSYQGEIISSLAAIEEAQRAGLVGTPVITNTFVNCPVVADDVTLDPGDGSEPMAPKSGFVRGRRVALFDLNAILGQPAAALDDDGVRVPAGEVYRLRRAGGEPLSEPLRGVDMTGDDDVDDTNDIFAASGPGIHLMRLISMAVDGAGEQLVDQTGDERMSTLDDVADLLDGEGQPDGDVVIAIERTEELRNLPFAAPGGAAR